MILDDKTILLIGGTGSFGRKFTEIVLKEYNPKVIRIYSRTEFLQHEMQGVFNDNKVRFFLGDIRDRNRLYRAMDGVDIVVHAAAQKHVPASEYNPIEAVKTNVVGAANIVDACVDHNVEKAIAISTDKAAHPTNTMGATKMLMEKLFIQGNVYAGQKRTRFACTRYGNIWGSRGGVIPKFVQQAKEGKFTITHEGMTRFWITLEDGVRFVIDSLGRMKGGEIFVPKIKAVRIVDVAMAMNPDAKIEWTGVRPAEKLDETLITDDEVRHTRDYGDYFVIGPEYGSWETSDSDAENTPIFEAYTTRNAGFMNMAELGRIFDG